MRPIRLELEAFGPYASVQSVDFERLAAAGLFLVAGPTGAGKSSIFDALCFALYGRLPGQRSDRNYANIRSDHAPASARCEVMVEFEAAGDRWRVHRQPEHVRPKKRGTGFTTDPAKARLEKWNGSGWQGQSTRPKEVNDECRDLVGLTYDQFERVVLLPQGKFQRALLAGSKERRELLSTLFRTSDLGEVEADLVEQAAAATQELAELDQLLDHDLRSAHDSVGRARSALTIDQMVGPPIEAPLALTVGNSASRIAGSAAAAPQAGNQSGNRLGDDDAPLRLDELVLEAESLRMPLQQMIEERDASDAERAMREKQAAEAERVAESVARRDRLRACRQELNAHHEAVKLGRELAAAGRLALQVLEAERVRHSNELRLFEGRAEMEEAFEIAEAELRPCGYELPSTIDAEAVHGLVEAVIREMETLESLRAANAQARAKRDAARQSAADAAVARDSLAAQRLQLGVIAAESDALEAERDGLAITLSGLEAATIAVERASAVWQQRTELDQHRSTLDQHTKARADLAARIDEARTEHDTLTARIAESDELASQLDATRAHLQSREAQLALHRRLAELRFNATAAQAELERIGAEHREIFRRFAATMAPALAQSLVEDEPCVVCGSPEHPAPAMPDPDQPIATLADVEAANTRLRDAGALAERVKAAIEGLVEQLGAASDETAEALEQSMADAQAAIAVSQAAVERQQRDTRRLHAISSQLAEMEERASVIEGQIAASEHALTQAQNAMGGALDAPLAVLAERHSSCVAHVETLRVSDLRSRAIGDELARIAKARLEVAEVAADTERQIAVAEATNESLLRQADAIEADIGDRLAAHDPDQRHDALCGAVDSLNRARKLSQRVEALASDLADRRRQVEQYLSVSGFATIEAAVDAHLDLEEIERLEEEWRRWDERSRDTDSRLGELADMALPERAPDVQALVEQATSSGVRHRHLVEVVSRAQEALDQASTVLGRCASHGERTADKRGEVEQIRQLAETCRGNNARRTTLESWVLAGHLRRVVDHANIHLADMSRGRYRLVVPAEAVKSQGYAGLDLLVADSFSGRERPTASLSGGETFQASLALALGLADVVGAGRAGLALDALFIDEGFGSLDADALDSAIEVLDRLRGRGALVGVVTHVEALKESLPVGIQVDVIGAGQGSNIRQLV